MVIKPDIPVLGLQCITGLGKSTAVRAEVAELIRAHKAKGQIVTVVIAVPDHKLSAEQVNQFNSDYPDLTARRYLGISQPDPSNPDEKMCHREAIVVDLCNNGESLRNTCAKPRSDDYCPHHYAVSDLPCGYSLQTQQRADVWFVSHQLLFSGMPSFFGKVILLVIDETFWKSSIEGTSQPIRITLESISGDSQRRQHNWEYASYWSQSIYEAMKQLPDGFIDIRKINNALGYPESQLTDCYRAQMSLLSKHKVRPSMSIEELASNLELLTSLAAMKLAKFFDILRTFINYDGKIPFIEKRTITDAEGTKVWIYLYIQSPIHSDWDMPTIILDATMLEGVTREFFPQMEVQRFDCPMQYTTVTQIRDSKLSQTMMLPSEKASKEKQKTGRNNRQRLISLCEVLVSRNRRSVYINGRDITLLLVTTKAIEEQLLSEGLPDGVTTLHFGAVSGLDVYKDVPCIVIAGRLEIPPDKAEHQGSILTPPLLEPNPYDEGWYPEKISALETIDDIVPVPVTYHRESLVEEIRWGWNEGQILQAIGRGRGIRRGPDNPLELYILNNVPLPVMVDHVTNWANLVPTDIETTLARHAVVPLSYLEMMRIYPNTWPTMAKARKAVQNFEERYPEAVIGKHGTKYNLSAKSPIYNSNRRNSTQMRLFSSLMLVTYTLALKGSKPCRAIIRPGHGYENWQTALANVVGELKTSQIIFVLHHRDDPFYYPQINNGEIRYFDVDTSQWSSESKGGSEYVCSKTESKRLSFSMPIKGSKHPQNQPTQAYYDSNFHSVDYQHDQQIA